MKKPYIGIVHDGARIIIDIKSVMAASESEAYLSLAKLIPTEGVELANVKIVVWQAGEKTPIYSGNDHTENFEYWTQSTTIDTGITTTL